MKIVMVSTTPLAGSPYENAKCLNKYTDLSVRHIAWKNDYADGRVFPSDLLWNRDKEQCMSVLNDVDVVHIHNEFFLGFKEILYKLGKKFLIQFHSYPKRYTFQEMAATTKNLFTILQPMQLKDYGYSGLPNLIDPEEYYPDYHVLPEKPIVVFAPTNRLPKIHPGSKASDEVMNVLKSFGNRIEIDHYSNLEYITNLAHKRRADIIIDDVVGGTFHRTSLEGCCFGLAVVTDYSLGGLPKVNLSNLSQVLNQLLTNRDLLLSYKEMGRRWVMHKYHAKDLCKLYSEAYNSLV